MTEPAGALTTGHRGQLATPVSYAGSAGTRTTTLGAPRDRAEFLAGGLHWRDILPWDRIAVQFPDSEEALVVVWLEALMLSAFGARECARSLPTRGPVSGAMIRRADAQARDV
jgi:hypothetical protein